jgi:hypothetical protein
VGRGGAEARALPIVKLLGCLRGASQIFADQHLVPVVIPCHSKAYDQFAASVSLPGGKKERF